MRTGIFLFLLSSILLFSPTDSYSGEDPFSELKDIVLSFFRPAEGRAISIDDAVIVSDLVSPDIKKGMRLKIMRKGGKPYLHPITKELVGEIETQVGSAEVTETGTEGARLLLLTGEVKPGDILRVSLAKVKVLFYPVKGLSWNISEKYYDTLKETERFELMDTSHYLDKDSEIIVEAKRLGAEIVLILSFGEDVPDGIILRQRLYWTEDMKMHTTSEVRLDKAYAAQIMFGEELFKPPQKELFLSFDIPYRVNLIGTGDVDGDGIDELILSTGKDIVFYQHGKTLKPALEGIEIKGKSFDEHLWLDVFDLNGDKKDDILITLMRWDKVVSYAYEYKDKAFSLMRKWDFFVRVMEDAVYGQNYFRGEGFDGTVFAVTDDGKCPPIELPKGVNLYDFVFLESEGQRFILAYDENAYLKLYDMKGTVLWQSKEDYRGFMRTYKKDSPTEMVDRGEWSIKDRFFISGKTVILLRRVPILGVAKTGYKNSTLMGIELKEPFSVEERILIDYIPGRAGDFAVTAENIFILSYDVRIKARNILKGMGFVGNRVYAFPLKGRLNVIAR